MKKIVIASNNAGKLREFRAILEPFGLEVISQREAGFTEDVDETGTTFAENAALKARAVFEKLHCPVMVDALDGAPGVYSHRFAGENATDDDRNAKLLRELENVPEAQRTARFVCVLCYVNADGTEEQKFTGICEGRIGTQARGENGFGYDPLFYVNGISMAEMTEAEKNQISHRGRALEQLKEYFENRSQSC